MGGGTAAKVQVQASADLLTQEMGELKSFLQLCEERIELLQELQGMVKSGANMSLPEAHTRMLKEQLPLMSEVALDEDKAPTGSADDHMFSKAIILQDSPVSFIKILAMRAPRSSGSGSSSSSASQSAMPNLLVVAVQTDGAVRLFTPTGDLVLSFNAGHDHPVTSLATSPSHDEYFVATSDAGGVIRVHKINVRQRRLTQDQKKARRNSTDEKVSQYLGAPVDVTMSFTHKMEVPAGPDGEVPRVTTLATGSQQGNKFFAAGDAAGQISAFSRNGTFRGKVDVAQVPGMQVEGLYGHLSNLIFYGGNEWGFVNLEKMEVLRMECLPFEGRITTMVFDTQQGSRLLVGDEEGTVWVLNVKERKNCKVEHRFPKGATQAPVKLASIKGFAIALESLERGSSPASVLALNMSHVGKKQENQRGVVAWRKGRQGVRDWAVHKRHQAGDSLVFLSEDGLEIEVMELMMQVYTPPSTESPFGNFKMPVIAVAIVLVLGYQYMKGGKGKGGGGGKFGGAGADFGSLLKGKKGGLGGAGGLGKLGGLAGLKNRRR